MVVVAVVDSDYYQGQVAPMRKEEAVVVVVGQHYDNLEVGLHLVGGGVAVVV